MFGMFDSVGRGCSLAISGAAVAGLAIFVPVSLGDYVKNGDMARYEHYQSAYVQQNWPKDFRPNLRVTCTKEEMGMNFEKLNDGSEANRPTSTTPDFSAEKPGVKSCGAFRGDQPGTGFNAVAIDANGTLVDRASEADRVSSVIVPKGGQVLVEVPPKNNHGNDLQAGKQLHVSRGFTAGLFRCLLLLHSPRMIKVKHKK